MSMRTPIDMGDLLSEIEVPDIGSAQLALQDIQAKREQDIFAEQKRKGWDKTVEARCDFTPRPRLTSFYRTGRSRSMDER